MCVWTHVANPRSSVLCVYANGMGYDSKRDTDALFWEMEQLEFEANKTDILGFTSQRELEAYETLNAEIGKGSMLPLDNALVPFVCDPNVLACFPLCLLPCRCLH